MPEPETKPKKPWTGYVDVTVSIWFDEDDECPDQSAAIQYAKAQVMAGNIMECNVVEIKAVPDA
jgi:hypothetical protein